MCKEEKNNYSKVKNLDFAQMVELFVRLVEDSDAIDEYVCKKCKYRNNDCSMDSCPYESSEIVVKEFLTSCDGGDILV